MRDAFISYSSKDKPVADAVCQGLEEAGISCWIAPRDISPGDQWVESIVRAIKQSKFLVLIFSANTNTSPHVARELERAAVLQKPIVPLRIENVRPSRNFEYFLSSNHWLDAANGPLDVHIAQLASSLKAILESFHEQSKRIASTSIKSVVAEGDMGPPPWSSDVELSIGRRIIAFLKGLIRPERAYDVFISYRRDVGGPVARTMRSELRQRAFRVFLDVDDLGAGHFDEALLERIRQTPSFLVILTPSCLERCVDANDWFRRELALAIATNRNIVPIIMPGFKHPDAAELPKDLRPLPRHQSVVYSHEYFDAMIGKVLEYLQRR